MSDLVKLDSGRAIYANGGIVGIGPGGIYGGYDQAIEDAHWPADDGERLTPDERRKLADMAIAMWEEYAKHGFSK